MDSGQVKAIFADALELPPEGQDTFVQKACGGNEKLRMQVEALLRIHRSRPNVLIGPADTRLNWSAIDATDGSSGAGSGLRPLSETEASPSVTDTVKGGATVSPVAIGSAADVGTPQRIGPYVIVEALGGGGMGTVYKAHEEHPRRLVALKVIAPGLMTHEMRRRFEFEADVLARLEHPGIARVYRTGTAEITPGMPPQPYFAMELIDGRRLDEYVRRHQPSLSDRLKLLIKICQAVHHAHTKGVIHRDLKPANILVTDDGSPKVLDFGVARAIDSDIQTATMHTEVGQIIGSLPYMAPEQAAGKVRELDTSSDVYALGVIAYELLSGKMPYALQGKALHEAVHVICEEEPSRLSSVNKSLRGDVETIVQKALEKEKTRRYATAGELAADVKRFLDYEPISARPPSAWYNLRKFSGRNKAIVIGVSLLILILAGGIVSSTKFAMRAAQERDNAQATLLFLTDDVLANATPEKIRDVKVRDLIVSAVIEPASASVGERFKDRPLIEASIRDTLQRIFDKIGRDDLALPQAEAALALRRRMIGNDHPETITSLQSLATVLTALGRWREAEPMFKESLDRSRRVLGKDDPLTMSALNCYAVVLKNLGRVGESEPLFKQALDQRRTVLGEEHPDTITSRSNYASVLRALGRTAEAEPISRLVVDQLHRAQGDDHPATITATNNYGLVLMALERAKEAEELYKRVLEQCQRVLGPDHPLTLQALDNYGHVLEWARRPAEAELICKQALDTRRRLLGEDHPDAIRSMNNFAMVLRALHRYTEAEALTRDAVAKALSNPGLGPKHPYTRLFIENHAKCLANLGRSDEAAALRREFGLPNPSSQAAREPTSAPVNQRIPG